jgi:16S rRNA (guanine966-N2)-methyltransferase
MDRVKAAIFSSLAEKVIAARVLDLFAGAGGLGIEALSRGAASVIFVEKDRVAAGAIERNLAMAKFQAQMRMQDVFAFLRSATGKFDLIFADPPYEKTEADESYTDLLLNHPRLPELLTACGVFVLEKHPEESLPNIPLWNVDRSRRYGATEVLFLSAIRNPNSAIR